MILLNISARLLAGCLLLVAIVCGTLSDAPDAVQSPMLGGFHVLAADFHVHTFPLSAGTLAPWDIVGEARRQGLDAIAITGHNEVVAGQIGQWFSRRIGGPIVLAGEEIHAPHYHLIAAGIHATISWRRSAADAIDEAHRQGGIAIAAHPVASFWDGFDGAAMSKLDGAEVVQPIVYAGEAASSQMREFYLRAKGNRPLAAIGSSDYHGPGPLGVCRTYVFAKEATEEGILEALRAGRTVVFDRGRAYGDPELIRLLPRDPRGAGPDGLLPTLSRICGIAGLVGLILSVKGKVVSRGVQ
jgi:hypothetical protein